MTADQHAERLLEEWWPVRGRRMAAAELVCEAAGSLLFLLAAVALVVVAPEGREAGLALTAGLTLVYAVTAQVRFAVGGGSAVPTHLALVPLLFALPPAHVPLVVFAAMFGTAAFMTLRGTPPRWRVLMSGNDAWHSIGAALVLVLAGQPDVAEAPVLVLLAAFAASCAVDWVTTTFREWVATGLRPTEMARVMVQASVLDLALAPIGLAAAHAGRLGALLVLPLAGLFTLLSRDRSDRIDRANARLEALRQAQARLRGAARRTGDVLAARLDTGAMIGAGLDAALDAVDAPIGRVVATSGDVCRGDVASADAALRAAAAAAAIDGPPVAVHVGGVHALGCREPEGTVAVARASAFSDEEEELFAYVVAQASAAVRVATLHELFRRQAVTDDLTGLGNHRQLQEALDARLAAGGAVSLVLLDVDDFKLVNDGHGHAMGDEALRAVGRALAALPSGLAARYGGEEFALVVDGDLAAARRLAEQACAAVRSIERPLRITASCGAATAGDRSKDALFGAADAALYAAKRAGKDRVCSAPPRPAAAVA